MDELIARMDSIERKLDMLIAALADDGMDEEPGHWPELYPERDQNQPL